MSILPGYTTIKVETGPLGDAVKAELAHRLAALVFELAGNSNKEYYAYDNR
jgi:hypothetical protein